MSALAAQRPQRMQRFFLLSSFPFLCPCLRAWIDRQKDRRDHVETLSQTKRTTACPTAAVVVYPEFTFLLILMGNLPSHALRDAVASPKAVNVHFLIGPMDQRGVNKALDDARYVPQTGVATEVELVVATGELVGSDPQIKLNHSQVPTSSPLQTP